MTTKHTPGSWLRIDGPDYAEIHAAFRPSLQAVALVAKAGDADLIAAAPDLLYTLQCIANPDWSDATPDEMRKLAADAVGKAGVE